MPVTIAHYIAAAAGRQTTTAATAIITAATAAAISAAPATAAMSPLTCILLALAALSASATPSARTSIPRFRTSDVWFGNWTPNPKDLDPVELSPTGGTVNIINHCDPAHPTRQPPGEHVTADNQAGNCNPVITGRWSKINVECTPTNDCDCIQTIKVDITQYCDEQ